MLQGTSAFSHSQDPKQTVLNSYGRGSEATQMPSSRALKGIANGLVETFVSRNNDVSGYWGIGQIQRELEGHPDAVVELDLLHGKATPDGPIARELVACYSTYLSESLARDGFNPSAVTTAKVLVEFGSAEGARTADYGSTWSAFSCKAVLESRSGKVFSAVRAGSSRPHDSKRELRSNRSAVSISTRTGHSK